MRALLLHHPYTYPRFEQDFVDRVAELPEFDVVAAGTRSGGARRERRPRTTDTTPSSPRATRRATLAWETSPVSAC
ncbi:MAG: hypothetical protein IPF47_21855 [Gemmatimonadetes bacterium]|nr:hypothetical protein [Gemmatimonadota bacterium]